MTLHCPRCKTARDPEAKRHFAGPYQDRSTGEWIVRCDSCGAGQVVDAPVAAQPEEQAREEARTPAAVEGEQPEPLPVETIIVAPTV